MTKGYRKISGILVAMLMVASVIFVFGIVENTEAAASDLFDGTLVITSPTHGAYVSGVVNVTWSGVNIAGGIYPITYNVTFSTAEGTGGDHWTWDGGNESMVKNSLSGNATYYLWNTTSSGYKLPDGEYWVNVTATASTGNEDHSWVNATSRKLILRNTLPGTPGVNIYQGGRHWLYNSTTTLANNYKEVIRTPATTSLYAGAEDVDITLNNSLAWDSGETYYLWKPVYNGSKGTPALYNLAWERYGTTPGTYVTGSSTNAMTFDNIDLDRAGLWLICEGNDNWGSGANFRTIETYNSTGFAWFWVNTSKDYALSMDSQWTYNDSGNLAFTVTDSAGANTESMVDVRCDRTGNSTFGESKYAETGTYTYTHGKNNSYFWEVGNYTAHAYVDTDYYSTTNGKQYYTENAMDGATDDSHYNETYGSNANKNGSASWFSTYAAAYNWSACGPWDPPEHNATVVAVRVKTGTPYTNVPTDNYTMYWGFDGQVNISVKETSTGAKFRDMTLMHVYIFSNNGTNLTSHFAVKTIAGDPAGTSCKGVIDLYNLSRGWIHIDMNSWGQNVTTSVGIGNNGTWKAIIYYDVNSDRNTNGGYGHNAPYTEEWNKTVKWKVRKAPKAQWKWIDDDGSVWSNANTDGVIPYIPAVANVPLAIKFKIFGQTGNTFGGLTGGQDGKCVNVLQCAENITISGNSLFTGTLAKYPGYGLSGSAAYCGYSGGIWTIPVIPTMSVGGGSITIKVIAYNTTVTKTISIGGSSYETNGTVVSVTPFEFDIDQANQTITITAKNSETGTENTYGEVELYYIDDGTVTVANICKPITAHKVKKTLSSGGVYSFWFNETQQTTNQTTAGFSAAKAPRNLTAYFKASGHREGYALIQMKPVSDLEVEISRSTFMAGYSYDNIFINCTFAGNSTDTPSTKAVDKTAFHMKIVDENNNDVTGTTSSNGVLNGIYDTVLSGSNAYSFNFDTVYGLDAGTYTIYAWNNTHNSEGYNATFVIKPVEVECDKAPFIWKSDKNISATFTITYDGQPVNGSLKLENMSDAGTYNQTWTNCSTATNSSLEIGSDDVPNGIVTVHDITADAMHPNKEKQYITFWFKPLLADSSDGEYARAKVRMNVEVPAVAPDPQYIPLGRTTKVYTTVTGRGTALPDVFVRLHGCGFDKNSTSDVDGRVQFSISPSSTGNISIDVGATGRTLSGTVVYVTSWVLDVSTDVTTVEEGGTFTVTVMKEGTTEYVEGADITFNGETLQTDANGQAAFTAPQVTSDQDFTITASKTGYAPEPNTVSVRVTNTPGLTITVSSEAKKDGDFVSPITVTVSNEDTGALITGATVTFTPTEGAATTDTTVNGQVTFTETGTYTITATFGTFDPATYPESVTIVPGAPGFELLTLIAALGVAFILLRRRRK